MRAQGKEGSGKRGVREVRGQGGEGSGGQEGNKGTEQVRGAACAHLHAPIYKWLFARVLHGAAVWHLVSWAGEAKSQHNAQASDHAPPMSNTVLPHAAPPPLCPPHRTASLHHCSAAPLPPTLTPLSPAGSSSPLLQHCPLYGPLQPLNCALPAHRRPPPCIPYF